MKDYKIPLMVAAPAALTLVLVLWYLRRKNDGPKPPKSEKKEYKREETLQLEHGSRGIEKDGITITQRKIPDSVARDRGSSDLRSGDSPGVALHCGKNHAVQDRVEDQILSERVNTNKTGQGDASQVLVDACRKNSLTKGQIEKVDELVGKVMDSGLVEAKSRLLTSQGNVSVNHVAQRSEHRDITLNSVNIVKCEAPTAVHNEMSIESGMFLKEECIKLSVEQNSSKVPKVNGDLHAKLVASEKDEECTINSPMFISETLVNLQSSSPAVENLSPKTISSISVGKTQPVKETLLSTSTQVRSSATPSVEIDTGSEWVGGPSLEDSILKRSEVLIDKEPQCHPGIETPVDETKISSNATSEGSHPQSFDSSSGDMSDLDLSSATDAGKEDTDLKSPESQENEDIEPISEEAYTSWSSCNPPDLEFSNRSQEFLDFPALSTPESTALSEQQLDGSACVDNMISFSSSIDGRLRKTSDLSSSTPGTASKEDSPANSTSPVCDNNSEGSNDSGRGYSDHEGQSQSSEISIQFDFNMPSELCGRFIGKQGKNINYLKQKTGANVSLTYNPFTPEYQICQVVGTQAEIDDALGMIRRKFPLTEHPRLTMIPVNVTQTAPPENPVLVPDVMQMSLPEGVSVEVYVSAVVDAGQVFLQQPTHRSFMSLEKMNYFLNTAYSQDPNIPTVPTPLECGVICVCENEGAWYRAMIMSQEDEAGECQIKFVDYGGYAQMPVSSLKQIRTDFMSLPFQAVECFVANITPLESEEYFSEEATMSLYEMTQSKLLQCQVVARSDSGVPYVHLYEVDAENSTAVMINRALVNSQLTRWIEIL